MYRGVISLRKVHACIQALLNMPGRSALLASYDESTLWSTNEHLLMLLVNEFREAVWLWTSANSQDEIPKPELIKPPGFRDTEEESKEFASPMEVAEIFQSVMIGGYL